MERGTVLLSRHKSSEAVFFFLAGLKSDKSCKPFGIPLCISLQNPLLLLLVVETYTPSLPLQHDGCNVLHQEGSTLATIVCILLDEDMPLIAFHKESNPLGVPLFISY